MVQYQQRRLLPTPWGGATELAPVVVVLCQSLLQCDTVEADTYVTKLKLNLVKKSYRVLKNYYYSKH